MPLDNPCGAGARQLRLPFIAAGPKLILGEKAAHMSSARFMGVPKLQRLRCIDVLFPEREVQ